MTIDEIKGLAEETPYTVADIASSVQSSKQFNLPLNLQFFSADDGADGSDDGQDDKDTDDTNGDDKNGADVKTFTQKELDDIVAKRLARAEKDKQAAIDEAAKLAKMNADEKQKYEFEKLKVENEALKLEQTRYAMGREATKMLSEIGIVADDDLLDFVVKADAEATKQAVQSFSDLVTKKVDAAVKEKLKGTPPKKQPGSEGFKNPFSAEHFNLSEQGKLFKENPELAKQLQASK